MKRSAEARPGRPAERLEDATGGHTLRPLCFRRRRPLKLRCLRAVDGGVTAGVLEKLRLRTSSEPRRRLRRPFTRGLLAPHTLYAKLQDRVSTLNFASSGSAPQKKYSPQTQAPLQPNRPGRPLVKRLFGATPLFATRLSVLCFSSLSLEEGSIFKLRKRIYPSTSQGSPSPSPLSPLPPASTSCHSSARGS